MRHVITVLLVSLAILPTSCTPARLTPRPAARSPLWVGMVTHVTHGDTLKVQLHSGPINLRLGSIDAPEHDQPHGAEATAALGWLVSGKQVALQVVTQDRYERLVALVFVNGVNINEQLVKDGHAWAYRYFLQDRDYCRWEDAARHNHRGLWALPSKEWIYPFDWRRLQKHEITQTEDFTHETVEHCLTAVGKR